MLQSIIDMEKRHAGAAYKSAPKDISVISSPPVSSTKLDMPTADKEPKPQSSQAAATDAQLRLRTYAEYYRFLYNRISGAIKRPKQSGSGMISAAFILRSDGSLDSVEILEGSADDLGLRQAVEKAIRDSAPFPPFPEDIKEAQKTFTISLEFRYRR